MKKTRLFLIAAAAVFAATGCNNEWTDPDPLKESLEFGAANGRFISENGDGLTNMYILTFSNTPTRSSEVAIGETLSLEICAPVSDDLRQLPEGTYTFSSAAGANAIVKGGNSYMTSVYSDVAETYRMLTGGSVTIGRDGGKYTVTGKLASDQYEFDVSYSGALGIAADYSRIITFEAAELMTGTGNSIKYNNILWAIDMTEEDKYGYMSFDGVLYTEKGAGFGSYFCDWDGYWDAWGGFAVSRNYDKEDDSLDNQFSVHASDSGKFAVAYDVGNYFGNAYDRPVISFGKPCEPLSVMMANSTYTYIYCVDRIAGGSLPDFYLTAIITGYLAGEETGSAGVELAANGITLPDWTEADLTPLGTVDTIRISFDSNDANHIGLMVPTYCCIDNLKIK